MDWPQAREPLAAPIFAPFADAIAKLPRGRWPTHDDLTQAAADVVTSHGRRVRFAAPRAPGDRDRRSYELRIAETGDVADSLRFASAVAAIKCTRFGGTTGAPKREEVEEYLTARR